MEKWYVVYDKNTNELASTGSVIEPEKLPEHLAYREIIKEPDFAIEEWDKVNLKMKPRPIELVSPPIDRLANIEKDIAEIKSLLGGK